MSNKKVKNNKRFIILFLCFNALFAWLISGLLYDSWTNENSNMASNIVVCAFYIVTLIPLPSLVITMFILMFIGFGDE